MKKFLLFISLCFFGLLNINAETGYVSNKTNANMRDKPNTKDSTVLVEIPYKAEFLISDMNVGSGNGCSKTWYYVYYNNNYGYVCSNLVSIVGELETSYDRPWTSPKKAIIGGAKFISKGYISRGQYTPYLKKFNVNPNGHYPVYNHQYMANLRAPSSESYSTYKSLNANGLMDNTMNFVIPVFHNMPESTYDNNIKNTERQVADIQDEEFEKSIVDFPESYKPFLRYLHSKHSKWAFSILDTRLDFEEAYLSEKAVSSIEISSGLCEQNPFYETESGWCIGNEDSTKYYLDPRNFLSEKYIFMFENLAYSDIYNEDVVQSVLDGTFMSDMSILDNQTYKSIFVEAGKGANISPLYLASLARQESGTKISSTTNGEEFSYDGYTYKGVYNFFNIGANSSESNPAKAGLVWANGGRGANGAKVDNKPIEDKDQKPNEKPVEKPVQKEEETPVVKTPVELDNDFVSLLSVSKTGDYIKGYDIGTTIKKIKEKGKDTAILIKDSNGKEKKDDDVIGTGYTIDISNEFGSKTYTYVMYGDLSGDGEINSADLLKLRQYLLGQVKLKGAFLTSSYLTNDEEINSADLLMIRKYLLGTDKIVQK